MYLTIFHEHGIIGSSQTRGPLIVMSRLVLTLGDPLKLDFCFATHRGSSGGKFERRPPFKIIEGGGYTCVFDHFP